MTFTRLIVVVTFLFVKLMVTDMKIVGVNEQGRRVGQYHPSSKFNNSMVDLVIERHEAGKGYKSIAREFNISESTVRDWVKGRRRAQYPTEFKRLENKAPSGSQNITFYDKAKYWVNQYESVDEVKDYADKAAACEEYARRAGDTDMQRKAALARLRAERRCGELLAQMEKAKGTNGQLHGRDSSGGRTVRPPEEQPKTLADMGLTKDKSSTYQKLAKLPEDQFEKLIEISEGDGSALPTARNIINVVRPPVASKPKLPRIWCLFMDFKNNQMEYNLLSLMDELDESKQRELYEFLPDFVEWVKRGLSG